MQFELPIDGYASEYNDDIEFFVACYQHSDDPLQAFIRRELDEQASNAEFDYDLGAWVYQQTDWRI